jgi:hypothetical protein
MADANGTKRHKLLVVGGRDHNIPAWASAAFEIELVPTDCPTDGDGKIEPKSPADAIVIHTDYVSHNFSNQARAFAGAWKVPWFGVRKGWSSAVGRAATMRLDWFVDAVQLGGQAIADSNGPRADEAKELVENAWKGVAEHERARADAAEKRLGKEARDREKVESALARIRSGAEVRIVGEIRRRAAEVRAVEHEKLAPIRSAAAELVRSVRSAQEIVTTAQNSISSALRDVDRARGELNRLLDEQKVRPSGASGASGEGPGASG